MELIVLRNGEETRVEVEELGHLWRVRIGDRIVDVDAAAVNGSERSLLIEGNQYEVSVQRKGRAQFSVRYQGSIEELEVLDPLTYLASQGSSRRQTSGARQITAYMPGRVVAVLVDEGEAVEAGQGLVILEAMKMENEIQAEHAATVSRVFVTAGQAVEGGDPLFELE